MRMKQPYRKTTRSLVPLWREEGWRVPLVRKDEEALWNGHRFPGSSARRWPALILGAADVPSRQQSAALGSWVPPQLGPFAPLPEDADQAGAEGPRVRVSALDSQLAFTLIELLVVIGVIALLAGLLLPALSNAKTKAKEKSALTEMANLAAAISSYESEYSRYPASKETELAAGTNDMIFDGLNSRPTNSEIMVILLDLNQEPNLDHRRNPKRIPFFTAKDASDNSAPGLGPDKVLRDPWGNPYVVLVDLNQDGRVFDTEYGYGVINSPVAIFSFGRDKENRGVDDRNNLLSWK